MSPHRLSLLLLFLPLVARADSFKLPPGFEVTEYASSDLANDIYTLTIDPQGRVVVSGRGYIKVLADNDGDGKADQAILFADGPKDGAMGLLWEKDWLYVTGDGGLRRYPVDAGGDKAAGPSVLIRKMNTGGEHHAHAIRRGPDGWLYVLVGNTTGIDKSFATLPTSPISEPMAGCVLRFSPDLKQSEIVADGFRNAYDFDFNPDGELFTYDSDNERCVGLPWWEPTRFYHVISGGNYGWLSPQRGTFWRRPPYFPDVVAPLVTLDRGSPTGCISYRHVQFPEKYRGGFFLADWTFGRIYFVSLKRAGASYTAAKEVFLQSTGENGFAPTSMAVQPTTGDLFVSIGGRGTRGAVYRIRYPQGAKIDAAALAKLRLPERTLDWQDSMLPLHLRQAATGEPAERLASLLAIRRHWERFTRQEVLNTVGANLSPPHGDDRYLRWATLELAKTLSEKDRRAMHPRLVDSLQSIQYASGFLSPKALEQRRYFAVRDIQLALGDLTSAKLHGTVWEGYSPRRDIDPALAAEALKALRSAFPSGHADVDREIGRTLAMLQDDDAKTLAKVAGRFSADSPPLDDIHYLIVLARLAALRTDDVTSKVSQALIDLDQKIVRAKLTRDTFWPLRIAELHAELARKDPKLNEAILKHPAFGRPDHAVYCKPADFARRQAAERFLARSKEPGFAWNAELVTLIGELPPEVSLPILRKLWGEAGLEESLLPVLARHADPADRDKFLFGLRSPQAATLRHALDALDQLPVKADEELLLSLVRLVRRLSDSKEEKVLRERVGRLLVKLTGQDKLGSDPKLWSDWLATTHPSLAAKLGGADGVDMNAWKKRLAGIDWTKGDAAKGQVIFTKTSCANCHSGAQALGPDLRGVSGRFSRDDLLTAIVQPSRDIPSRYRTIAVETGDGKVYQGLIIYEATDSLILQTGPATTIRLVDTQIVSRGYSDISLMPAGTLDKLMDQEIADLLAYIRGLQ